MKNSIATKAKQTKSLAKRILPSAAAGLVLASLSVTTLSQAAVKNDSRSKLNTPAKVETALYALLDTRAASMQLAAYSPPSTSSLGGQGRKADYSNKSISELILAGLAITGEAKSELASGTVETIVQKSQSAVVTEEPEFVEEALIAEVPAIVEEAVIAEVPAIVEEALIVEVPAILEEAVIAEIPAIVEEALIAEVPAILEEAVIAEVVPTILEEAVIAEIPVIVEEALIAEVPAIIEEALIVEVPAIVEEAVITEVPAIVEEALIAEVPAILEEAVIAEIPVIVEEAVIAEVPAILEEAVIAEVPVVVEEAVIAEVPVILEEAKIAEMPVIVEEAVIAEVPVILEEAVIAEVPVVVEEAVIAEVPVIVEEALLAEVPTILEEALIAKVPPIVEEPVIAGLPAIIEPAVELETEEPEMLLASVSVPSQSMEMENNINDTIDNTKINSVSANVEVDIRSEGCPENFNEISIPVNGKLCQIFAADFPASMILFVPQTPEEVIEYYLASSDNFTKPKTVKKITMLKSTDNNATLIIYKDGDGTQVDILVKAPVS